MGEGTMAVTIADSELLDAALARIDLLETRLSDLNMFVEAINAYVDDLYALAHSATQVAECA